jgi:hypothetical protein
MSDFEKASKMKYRFTTRKGNLTTEDLWDLPLTSESGVSLDDLAKALNKEIKENAEESFVLTKTTSNKDLETKFSIVKRVIEVRLEEIETRKTAAARKAKKEQLLQLIYDKENAALSNKSIDELRAMLEE